MASPTDIKASKEKKKRKSKAIPTASPSNEQDDAKLTIPEHHPFFGWCTCAGSRSSAIDGICATARFVLRNCMVR